MSRLLYVYNDNKLCFLREKLKEFQFFSIAYFLHRGEDFSELKNLLKKENFDYTIIDISNFIKDGNYYRNFIEIYLEILLENIENISFCLNEKYLKNFLEYFPYFFEEENIDTEFSLHIIDNQETEEVQYETSTPLELYLYKNIMTAKKIYEAGDMISLASIIENQDGIILRYNIDNIANKINNDKIKYIDISSVIKTIKIRNDFIFPIEGLLYHISLIKKIKYCMESELLPLITENFPFVFTKEIYMDELVDDIEYGEEKRNVLDVKNIEVLANEINKELKGHSIFKNDFKHNLMKYSFLNSIGERKILSILLCGESGIGKTEFAKIISKKMFPKENLIKINFGNYSNEGVLNSLIGSPLGYAGSEEGGELINKIKTSKSRIILIDEFEKATPAIYNFFYELLEDGVFTDRHGIEHNLNGYIIVFTSNMTSSQYQKHIPDALKSRFDMVYYFVDLPEEEKIKFINKNAYSLIKKLESQFGKSISYEVIQDKLNELVVYHNLRDIKRKVEDIVFYEFFKS